MGSVASGVILAFFAAFALVACTDRSALTAEETSLIARAPAYPEEAKIGPSLDVVVVRRGDEIQVVNRTARPYTELQLWLNRQFVRPVERVEIGTENGYSLDSFANRYGESYPTGSFLRPEQSQRLVLAELYDPEANVRYKLTVQPEEQPETD